MTVELSQLTDRTDRRGGESRCLGDSRRTGRDADARRTIVKSAYIRTSTNCGRIKDFGQVSTESTLRLFRFSRRAPSCSCVQVRNYTYSHYFVGHSPVTAGISAYNYPRVRVNTVFEFRLEYPNTTNRVPVKIRIRKKEMETMKAESEKAKTR